MVFKGKVIKTERFRNSQNQGTKEEPSIISSCRFRETYFKVLENLKGAKNGDTIKIYSGCGGGDCGYQFENGETYMVFSNKARISKKKKPNSRGHSQESASNRLDPNKLWTSSCSGTVKLDRAKPTIEYLENIPKKRSGGIVFGRIFEAVLPGSHYLQAESSLTEKKVMIQQLTERKLILRLRIKTVFLE